MRFQRNLKQPRPLPRGYFAPPTDRVNVDQPTFQIGGNTDFSVIETIHLPEFLKVKARLHPIKRQGDDLFAVVERQGTALKPYAIYQEHQDYQYQAVQLVFESFLDKTDRTVLYNAAFLFWTCMIVCFGSCVLKQDTIERKLIVTPPGKENGQPLWGYGGYYKVGCDLKQIEQMFFMPIAQFSETNIHLTKASSWTAKGVMPSLTHTKPEIVFMDSLIDQGMLNLVGDIEQGKAKISLQIGIDETGVVHKQEYRSVSIQQEDALTPFVEVVFKA